MPEEPKFRLIQARPIVDNYNRREGWCWSLLHIRTGRIYRLTWVLTDRDGSKARTYYAGPFLRGEKHLHDGDFAAGSTFEVREIETRSDYVPVA